MTHKLHPLILVIFSLFLGACTQIQTLEPSPNPITSATPPATQAPPQTNTQGDCRVAGCSGQLCVPANQADDIVTTCEFKEEYACYKLTTCEQQANGQCGWTRNEEFTQCLEQALGASL